MELSRYLDIVKRRWWVVAIAFVATAAATLTLIMRQPDVYESSGTYVVRPRALEAGDAVSANDTLSRGVDITATYAAIARSKNIRDRAERLDASTQASDLNIDAEVVTGTNIVAVNVTGEDPEAVYALAVAVGDETTRYVYTLNDIYQLQPLDPPDVPTKPVGPNRRLLTAAGLVLGLLVGLGLAVLVEFIGGWARASRAFKVLDPQTDAYSRQYLEVRLAQEVSRATRTNRAFSLGVLEVARRDGSGDSLHAPAMRQLRHITQVLQASLGHDDVFAYLGDGGFAVILHNRSLTEADDLLIDWDAAIASIFGRPGSPAAGWMCNVTIGACEWRDGTFVGDPWARKVAASLTIASTTFARAFITSVDARAVAAGVRSGKRLMEPVAEPKPAKSAAQWGPEAPPERTKPELVRDGVIEKEANPAGEVEPEPTSKQELETAPVPADPIEPEPLVETSAPVEAEAGSPEGQREEPQQPIVEPDGQHADRERKDEASKPGPAPVARRVGPEGRSASQRNSPKKRRRRQKIVWKGTTSAGNRTR